VTTLNFSGGVIAPTHQSIDMNFSSDFDLNEIRFWHPQLLRTLIYLNIFCIEKGIPLHLNSGLRPRVDGFSKSRTHNEGRAVDIRIVYWSKEQQTEVVRYLQGFDHLEKVGAISKSDGLRRLGYFHKNHLHLQVSP